MKKKIATDYFFPLFTTIFSPSPDLLTRLISPQDLVVFADHSSLLSQPSACPKLQPQHPSFRPWNPLLALRACCQMKQFPQYVKRVSKPEPHQTSWKLVALSSRTGSLLQSPQSFVLKTCLLFTLSSISLVPQTPKFLNCLSQDWPSAKEQNDPRNQLHFALHSLHSCSYRLTAGAALPSLSQYFLCDQR